MKPKRDLLYIIAIIILVGLCGQFYYSYKLKPALDSEIKVYYNQDRELNKELIKLMQDADEFVYFAVYTFTRSDLRDALLAAKYRGLKVVGLTDKKQARELDIQTKLIRELKQAGIPVYEQDHLAIMHLKVLVTDKAYASGSFNWTSAATNLNDEVLEIGRDETIRRKYLGILEKLFAKYAPSKL